MLARNEVSKASTSPSSAAAISTEWMTRRVSFCVSVTGTELLTSSVDVNPVGGGAPDGSTTTLRRPLS